MADPLRHRQTKGAATDMVDLTPPRHIPTLPDLAVCWPEIEWQVLAALADVGERGSGPLVGASRPRHAQGRDIYLSSQLNLLGNAQRVVDLDPEVTNCAFELRVPRSSWTARRLPVFL